ncbi:MFS transporter [Modestobacter sp. VKM Ac-2986]|uniref:MFS transporter n=1 Tax=Modestobacter sp. VKM Ac-2986 TaxID=3004140 RepID=UPI0022AAFB5B|nr:MFS transporter [Modestobacter sp. VKM Ac-2986]MCZ2828317.1 MFS transporter [Modestobacter sp. VKM Ac-2986]
MPALPRALMPLRHPGYRWLAVSLVLTLTSSGLYLLAVVWQVIELGGGPAALSLVSAGTAVGMLLTTLLGGALADRVPQRRLLLVVAVVELVATGVVAALSLAGLLQLWHLAVASLLIGLGQGLYYPAYSALVPALLPADELLAANGLEGVLRPLLTQAAGPAAAGAIVAAASPGAALLVTAVAALGAVLALLRLPATPLRRDLDAEAAAAGGPARHPVTALLHDVRAGFSYMVATPWLLATLVFASLLVLVVLGPLEVLTPFALREQTGGGPSEHSLVLASFGIAGAVGSLAVASRPLPRRYLTLMITLWGAGCAPLAVFGVATELWLFVLAAAVAGAAFQGATVIWGTLLQRRVPPAMLGRVSSLDFFVSLAFLPVSMALAGPVSGVIGVPATFALAGLVPPVLAAVAIVVARLPADEIAHPLDTPTGTTDDTADGTTEETAALGRR